MWGYNWAGQFGNGTTESSYVPIKVMVNVSSVSLGGANSAVITTDGNLYMIGFNGDGQLGNGVNAGANSGTVREYDKGIDSNIPIKIMNNVITASLGEHHSATITADGSLYMWGVNWSGELGNDTNENCSVPIKIEIPVE